MAGNTSNPPNSTRVGFVGGVVVIVGACLFVFGAAVDDWELVARSLGNPGRLGED